LGLFLTTRLFPSRPSYSVAIHSSAIIFPLLPLSRFLEQPAGICSRLLSFSLSRVVVTFSGCLWSFSTKWSHSRNRPWRKLFWKNISPSSLVGMTSQATGCHSLLRCCVVVFYFFFSLVSGGILPFARFCQPFPLVSGTLGEFFRPHSADATQLEIS